MPPEQDLPPERRPWRILGVRGAALLETAGLLAAALAADASLLGGDRFAEIGPHPFWAAVLLAASQYGAREGLVAAALSTAALLAGNLPEQGFGEDLYAWLLRISGTPVLWITAGVLLGGIRDGHRRRADALGEELADAREQARAIAEAYERLSRTASDLEARVAGQVRTVRAVYTAARAIERQSTVDILIGVATLVRSVLGPSKFSLFLLNGHRLEVAATEGWTPHDRFTRELGPDCVLFRAVVGGHRFLAGVNPEHEAALQGQGMLAGPVVSAETGKVVGMLKVEEIPFVELNPSGLQNFRIICHWVGAAYDNALRFERLVAAQGHAAPLVAASE